MEVLLSSSQPVYNQTLPSAQLKAMLPRCTDRSYHRLSVDGDTSTNDTLVLLANGASGVKLKPAELVVFEEAAGTLMEDLAKQIARDGEGAKKLITIEVTGARDDAAAGRIARTIANSPLVKTAIAGGDANWGRIVMAVGKAGEKADRDRLAIAIGGVPITENGAVRPDYDETPVNRHIAGREVKIAIDVGIGRGRRVRCT